MGFLITVAFFLLKLIILVSIVKSLEDVLPF